MLQFSDDAKIYLKPGPTDMRKSINTLVPIVEQEMKQNPLSAGYFVFCNKSRQLLKILYWDKTGFALWLKRLEEGKFPWPENPGDAQQLTPQQIQWLLAGIDFLKAHKPLEYSISY